MVCLRCDFVSLVVQVTYGWSMVCPAAPVGINIQPLLQSLSAPSSGPSVSLVRAESTFPCSVQGQSKGWDSSQFLPKHIAPFICHPNPIYFYQNMPCALTTQCTCFCWLYPKKSLILTLKNPFILQWLLVGLCTSLLFGIFPPCLFLQCWRWDPGFQSY